MSLLKDKSDTERSDYQNINPDALNFTYLPAYAGYLLKNKLHDFSRAVLTISREVEVPLLRFFDNMPEDELLSLSMEGTREFLTYFTDNRVAEFIDLTLKRWLENQLPQIQHHEVVAKDISSVNFARRKSLRRFLAEYTQNFELYDNILNEIDQFILAIEDRSYNTLFDLKQQHINEQLYFIDKINNTLPGVIYLYDLAERKEVYSNIQAQHILGYSPGELGSAMFINMLHPDDAPKRLEQLASFADTHEGEIKNIEFRVQHKNGRYHWFRAYESLFKRNPDGQPAQIIGLMLEITTEKESMQTLQLREMQLREAYEIAGIGSFEWDLQGGESVFSDQMMKVLDQDGPTDYLVFLNYVHPADQIKLTGAINEAIVGGGHYECEYRYNRGKDKIIWTRGVVTFLNDKPFKMRGTVMDITERHKMMQKLQETIELHKQAQALTHIGNWAWDIPNNIIEWSDEMYRIYGLEPQSEKIDFERFMSLVHPDDRERRLNEIQSALATHVAEDYVLQIKWDDGTIRILQGKGEIILDDNNKPVKLTGTCQDVTEQYHINCELEQTNKELQRRNEELTAFNYIASHDLQEPLRKIKLFSNRIFEKDYEQLPATTKEFLPRILNSANRMQKLLNDLLAFSRATLTDHIFESVSIGQVIEEIKTSLKETIEEKQAGIIYGELPLMRVIPYQFRQLLENIIVNAIKYSKPDVPPEILIESAEVQGKYHVKEGATAGMNYYRLSVKDNGIGFDQQYAEKIFELFQRLHSKNEYSGTGIGLAICKKIIQNHQGFITATSEPGKGATFSIFIPIG
ncbi:PAS domain-containing protein [Emticicia sp. TH156]|uniref:PAS domain-containing sensor histidine kinase n=1 Tax=Emticicia sp. TH156 TaxID=2067454 RepID=UPI000C76296C|nr:PAS domain-containing protein [Emticicia sp. TH156]PLK44234.1 hypothetical protein C0V77_10560 [Emticicia sp. TH156]